MYAVNLSKDKKGMTGKIAGLVSALIFIIMVVALGPTMFSGLNITGAPDWLATVLPVIVASGLLFGIWRSFK